MYRTPLILKADPKPNQWVVVEPLVWSDAKYGTLVTPAGFRTDLASTPFHIDDGYSRPEAVTHDTLYNLGQSLGKDFADNFLHDAIIALGAGRIRAQTYYLGVHLFGGLAWRAAAKEPEASHFETAIALNNWRLSGKTVKVLT